MKSRSLLLPPTLAILLVIGMCTPVLAYIEDYLPAGVLGKMKPISLKQLAEVKPAQTLQLGNVKLSNQGDVFSLKGTSKSGKPWSLERDPIGFGGTLYQADLDRNGHPDLLLITNTAACGIAPPREVTILLFDKNGTPRGFRLAGYFNSDEKKNTIEDLVRLRGGGTTPVLLHQELVYATTKNKDRSYWRWVAYRAVNCRMEAWNVTLGSTPFPCYVWYTFNPNHRLSATKWAFLEKATKAEQEQRGIVEVEMK